MTDLTFDPELVAPFYRELMNANVLALSSEEQGAFACRFRKALPFYSDDLIIAMLGASWRPAKVAAWVIAARQDQRFLPHLADRLLRSPGYAEHLCIALAALGSAEAIDALSNYVRSLLPPSGHTAALDEAVSPDWAIAALTAIDAQTGMQRAAELLVPGGPWEQFIASRPLLGPRQSDALRQGWASRLAKAQSLLPAALAFIRSHLS